jgi:hypothetical protein
VVGVCEVEGRGEQTKLEDTFGSDKIERCPICKVDLLKVQKPWLDQRHVKRYAHEMSSQG